MNFTFEITGVEATSARLMGMDERIRHELRTEMEFQMVDLVQDIVGTKLSGQLLQRKSGRLADSITADVSDEGGSIVGRAYVAGNVPYAGILEHGGQTAAHIITPKAALALHFLWNGDEVFRAVVRHPGSKIPEFAYMRVGLYDMTDQILAGLQEAVERGAK